MVNDHVKKILTYNKFILHTRQIKNLLNKDQYIREQNKKFSKRILIEAVGNLLKQDLELEHTWD